MNLPPIPEIPEPVRGKSFAIIEAYHLGNPAGSRRAARAAARARATFNDTIDHRRDAGAHPPAPGPRATSTGRRRRASCSSHLPANALDAFVGGGRRGHAQFPLTSIELRHLAGELRRTRPEYGGLDSIDADYAMGAVGIVPAPELEAPVRAPKCRPSRAALRAVGGEADVPELRGDAARHGEVLGPSRPTTACAASKPPSTPTTSSAQTTRYRQPAEDGRRTEGPWDTPSPRALLLRSSCRPPRHEAMAQ